MEGQALAALVQHSVLETPALHSVVLVTTLLEFDLVQEQETLFALTTTISLPERITVKAARMKKKEERGISLRYRYGLILNIIFLTRAISLAVNARERILYSSTVRDILAQQYNAVTVIGFLNMAPPGLKSIIQPDQYDI